MPADSRRAADGHAKDHKTRIIQQLVDLVFRPVTPPIQLVQHQLVHVEVVKHADRATVTVSVVLRPLICGLWEAHDVGVDWWGIDEPRG